jgi:hypothetical protein
VGREEKVDDVADFTALEEDSLVGVEVPQSSCGEAFSNVKARGDREIG